MSLAARKGFAPDHYEAGLIYQLSSPAQSLLKANCEAVIQSLSLLQTPLHLETEITIPTFLRIFSGDIGSRESTKLPSESEVLQIDSETFYLSGDKTEAHMMLNYGPDVTNNNRHIYATLNEHFVQSGERVFETFGECAIATFKCKDKRETIDFEKLKTFIASRCKTTPLIGIWGYFSFVRMDEEYFLSDLHQGTSWLPKSLLRVSPHNKPSAEIKNELSKQLIHGRAGDFSFGLDSDDSSSEGNNTNITSKKSLFSKFKNKD